MKTIREALAIMETGEIFSLQVVSYDKARKTGGERLEYPEAVLVTGIENDQVVADQTGQRALTGREQRRIAKKKSPHHSEHFTRNIRIMQSGHPTSIIKKIHPPLILFINGEKIVV